MSSFLKVALIAGGVGYFLFHQQIAAALAIPAVPGGTPPPPAPQPGPTHAPTATAATTDAVGTKALILQHAQTDANFIANAGRMSVYQWNFYYKLVRNLDAPGDLGFTDNAALVSLDEYWAAATAHGLAGLRGRLAPPPYRGGRIRSAASGAWGITQ